MKTDMKKFIVIAAVALVSFASCSKDFLNEAPLTAQSDELTLSTIGGVNDAVGGSYATLASQYWYGAEFIIRNEMKTSNGKKSLTHDTGRLIKDYSINYSPNNTYSGLWNYAYYTIYNVNEIIDKINSSYADNAAAKNYMAECKFLRALAYFDLVRVFAQPYAYTADASHLGVPIILHKDLEAKPKRNTVKEVYAQIISDLDDAEKDIDPSYRRAGTDPASSVSIYAIWALRSRVALYSQNWDDACKYATNVIDSGKYNLWTKDDYLSVNGDDASSVFWLDAQDKGEVIFEVYGNKSNSYDGYHDGISPMTTPEGYGDAAACGDLVDLYELGDVRADLFIEDGGDIWTAKYYGKGISNPDANNTIVLRLSEMYLNRAEALINGATPTGSYSATSDLEAIQNIRGASTSAATLTNIYLERQKELAWEGHLWFDLARTGRPMKRVDVLDGVIAEIPYPDYRWAMPIPDHDMSANPNLVQNEGYGK